MSKFANARIAQGFPIANVIFVRDTVPVGKVIDDLLSIPLEPGILQPPTGISQWLRGCFPKTRHKVVFEIHLPQSTVSNRLHTDKNALRERIVVLQQRA